MTDDADLGINVRPCKDLVTGIQRISRTNTVFEYIPGLEFWKKFSTFKFSRTVNETWEP